MSVATLPPMRVPTLTEVVEWPPSLLEGSAIPGSPDAEQLPVLSEAVQPQEFAPSTGEAEVEPVVESIELEAEAEAEASVPTMPALTEAIDEAALTRRIVGELQHRVDLALEDQLRAALAPMLDRLMHTLVREARDELAPTLRDVVAKAVSHELEQHRHAPDRADPD
jgi:hypothetical protein